MQNLRVGGSIQLFGLGRKWKEGERIHSLGAEVVWYDLLGERCCSVIVLIPILIL
jgi:hypothetical protein